MIGIRKLPSVAGIQEEKDHHDAVNRKEPIVGFRLHQRALRLQKMDAHQGSGKAANHEHKRNRDEIQDPDAFVVDGEEPRLDSVARV
jgi:hypothetical protein